MRMADIKVGEVYAVTDHGGNWRTIYRMKVLKVKVHRWVSTDWGRGKTTERADGVQGKVFREDGTPVIKHWPGARRPGDSDRATMRKRHSRYADDFHAANDVFNVQTTKVFMLWSEYVAKQIKKIDANAEREAYQAGYKLGLEARIADLPERLRPHFKVVNIGHVGYSDYRIVLNDNVGELVTAIQNELRVGTS